jgi:ComF family protein
MYQAFQKHLGEKAADLVVPVPLHRKRQAERGLNQSEVLALELAERLKRPVSVDNLRRIRATPSQTRFTRAERERNVAGAFAVQRPADFEDKDVLLVDDVMTTGATTSECARVLYGAGATSVVVMTAAR